MSLTPSVMLRPLEPSDADVMARWGDDPHFCRAADWSMGVTHAERAAFFDRFIACPQPDLLRLAAISQGVMVGYVDLSGTGPDERDLGFVIGGRDRWGRGLGRAAAAAACVHGFETMGLQRIWAEAEASHLGSIAILKGLGMSETPTVDENTLGFSITPAAWLT